MVSFMDVKAVAMASMLVGGTLRMFRYLMMERLLPLPISAIKFNHTSTGPVRDVSQPFNAKRVVPGDGNIYIF